MSIHLVRVIFALLLLVLIALPQVQQAIALGIESRFHYLLMFW